jgi:hypothetical protein
MWDNVSFNNVSHQLQLYELQSSSLYVTEADALVELATAIGKDKDPEVLELAIRATAMRTLIQTEMWDEQESVFSNKFPNGTFYPRISPTSFYPLLANASTDSQAEAIVKHWLTNRSRFCINPNYKTENSDTCYWGLPSISADDPAFCTTIHNPSCYWRGFVWGPMTQVGWCGYSRFVQLCGSPAHSIARLSARPLVRSSACPLVHTAIYTHITH